MESPLEFLEENSSVFYDGKAMISDIETHLIMNFILNYMCIEIVCHLEGVVAETFYMYVDYPLIMKQLPRESRKDKSQERAHKRTAAVAEFLLPRFSFINRGNPSDTKWKLTLTHPIPKEKKLASDSEDKSFKDDPFKKENDKLQTLIVSKPDDVPEFNFEEYKAKQMESSIPSEGLNGTSLPSLRDMLERKSFDGSVKTSGKYSLPDLVESLSGKKLRSNLLEKAWLMTKNPDEGEASPPSGSPKDSLSTRLKSKFRNSVLAVLNGSSDSPTNSAKISVIDLGTSKKEAPISNSVSADPLPVIKSPIAEKLSIIENASVGSSKHKSTKNNSSQPSNPNEKHIYDLLFSPTTQETNIVNLPPVISPKNEEIPSEILPMGSTKIGVSTKKDLKSVDLLTKNAAARIRRRSMDIEANPNSGSSKKHTAPAGDGQGISKMNEKNVQITSISEIASAKTKSMALRRSFGMEPLAPVQLTPLTNAPKPFT